MPPHFQTINALLHRFAELGAANFELPDDLREELEEDQRLNR
jgi:hypothetical protein